VLAFSMDYALKLLRSRAFPWTELSR
jgi:hypothetical protein